MRRPTSLSLSSRSAQKSSKVYVNSDALRSQCPTDSVDVVLQIGSFALKVRRSVTGEASSSGATAVSFPPMQHPSPFISTSSIDEAQILPPPQSSNGSSPPSVDEDDDVDENLLYIGSPKVLSNA